jgi:hypothetical protein
MLLAPLPTSASGSTTSNASAEGEELLGSSSDPTLETQPEHEKLPPYLAVPVNPRGALSGKVLGAPPNKHESLFWFDRKGENCWFNQSLTPPKGSFFLKSCIQVLLLLCSIYLAFVGFEFYLMISHSVAWYFVILYLLGK